MTTSNGTHKPEPTAAEMYAARRADIAKLIDLVEQSLEAHGEKAKARPGDWGFAGDLARVRRHLITAVTHLCAMDEDDIEDFLAE
jgi:hypothetical protein